jgi:Amt family ammonium transporter
MMEQTVNAGDTAWVLSCAGLVMFMTPGLAFFYAGMVDRRNTLVMLQQNMVALGVISVTWILLGYSLAFGADGGAGLIGDLKLFGLIDAATNPPPAPAFHVVTAGVTIPTLAFVAYQMMFAVITPALATGAVAGRLRLAGWIVFLAAWSIIVYPPIAHWIWHPDGWLASFGVQDWAGGLVVHTSAGAAALALLLVVGRRRGWPRTNTLPQSVPLTLVGAGILWFGWFGFNAGDGLQANGVAAQAAINTHVAAAAGMCVWLLLERIVDGHSTVVGAASGAVAGLATVTPCAGFVSTLAALAIGAIAGLVCHLALKLKFTFRFDDALDVIAVHFVGGMLGTLLLGLFGNSAANSTGVDGLFFGGGAHLLGRQVVGVVVVAGFSFCLTWLLATVIDKTMGLRVRPDQQGSLDQRQQGMDAYHLDEVSSLPGKGSPGHANGHVAGGRASGQDQPRPVPAEASRLVTGLLDPALVHEGDLRDALDDAGARAVTVSEANLYGRSPQSLVVRGYRRDVELTSRLRVEVLVDEQSVPAVLRVLDRFADGTVEGFVETVRPAAATRR